MDRGDVGGLNPSEKYDSQWEGLSHLLWKIKHVPNHQAEYIITLPITIYLCSIRTHDLPTLTSLGWWINSWFKVPPPERHSADPDISH